MEENMLKNNFNIVPAWKSCSLCKDIEFKYLHLFLRHLRENHCKKEGGSYICTYSKNSVCTSLPVEGVNDNDYETHVYKHHAMSHSITPSQTETHTINDLSWDMFKASQNLPSVLNDPSKLKQKDLFTKTWGDHFVELHDVPMPSYLPDIKKQHFEMYLKKISKRCRRRQKSEIQNDHQFGENSILSPLKVSSPLFYKSYNQFDLSEIPKIYLKSDFKLNNLSTFNLVFPSHYSIKIENLCDKPRVQNESEIALSNSPPSYHNSTKLLQEKLSHYLDIVEVQIAVQVAKKSDAFFHAMSSHDCIMDQLKQTILQVKGLRDKLHDVDETQVKKYLLLIQLENRRRNLQQVVDKLKLMSTILQAQPEIKVYLSIPNYVAALELIEHTKEILVSRVSGIHSFRHLLSELKEMTNMIESLMIGEFERFVCADLNRPLNDAEVQFDTEKLICIVLGFLKQGSFEFLNIYRKETESAIKAIIKSCAIEVVSSSNFSVHINHSELTSLDEQLKFLNIFEWLNLIKNCTHSLGLLLLRIKTTYDTVINAIFEQTDEVRYKEILTKFEQLISAICMFALNRCAYLISKSSVTSYSENDNLNNRNSNQSDVPWLCEKTSINHLTELQGYVNTLTETCENILPKDFATNSCSILKSSFKSEAIKFMQRYHSEQKSRLELIMESESWKKAEVPVELELLLENIVRQGCFKSKIICSETNLNNCKQFLEINNEKYAVIGTVVILISMITEYSSRGEELLSITHILPRYVGELLQLFNSQTYKLILGGEAVSEKTGLKKITSSNLALALRALQLVLYLIPFIVVHFQNLLGANVQLSHLNNVSDRIRDHIKDIRLKLLSIITQVVNMELQHWKARPPVPSKSFQVMGQKLYNLNEAVSGVLPRSEVHLLYSNINKMIKSKLKELLAQMNIVNDGGPQYGVVVQELLFYLEGLKQIDALPKDELSLSVMDDIWT